MAKAQIHGYSDQISVKPGDRIRFMVSVENATVSIPEDSSRLTAARTSWWTIRLDSSISDSQ
jgi:hypothetical protein